jgi:hypothetical protein
VVDRLFALDQRAVQGAFFRHARMSGGLGDHGEQGAERGLSARSIDPGHEARVPAFGITRSLHLVDDRVGVREQRDLVQGLVIDIRPDAKVKPSRPPARAGSRTHRFSMSEVIRRLPSRAVLGFT